MSEEPNCPSCGWRSYARIDQQIADGSFAPGPYVRCIECKREWMLPLPPPPDAGEVLTYRDGVADKDVETRLLHTAKLLYENALGCIRLHHGHRSNESDLPGWLADCRRDIEAADAAAIRKLP